MAAYFIAETTEGLHRLTWQALFLFINIQRLGPYVKMFFFALRRLSEQRRGFLREANEIKIRQNIAAKATLSCFSDARKCFPCYSERSEESKNRGCEKTVLIKEVIWIIQVTLFLC